MKTATTIAETRATVKAWKKEGLTIGLVPTMGFLHAGHESLIRRSAAENDRTVVSVFVNPMQFGKNEDLDTYPRDFQRDSEVCRQAGADLIFHPQPEEMYPPNFFTYTDMHTLTDGLCGAGRPGHFRGVCTVVGKLFHITAPDRAYFGQKDAQQLAVIRKMVRDLNFDLEIVGCPTVREADGLAQSSRNARLSAEERRQAPVLYQALNRGRQLLEEGYQDAETLRREITAVITTMPLATVEYVEIVDGELLQPVETVQKPALVAVAVRFGKTRLIDNFFWE